MGQTTGLLTKSLEATAQVRKNRLVIFGAADGAGIEAVGSAAFIVGVAGEIDTEIGERISVHSIGNIADVLYGGTVTRGDPLTSDAQGRAITAAPAAAANAFIVGFAEVSGVVGDIGSVYVAPGRVQG